MDSQIPSVEPQHPEADPPSGFPSQPGPLEKIFIGPNGLRSGWKAAIFLVVTQFLILFLTPFLFLVVPPFEPHQPPRLSTLFGVEVFEAVITLLMTGVMAKVIDKRKWGYFGLPLDEAFRSKFWVGAVTAFCALAIQLELMHLGGWFDFGQISLHGAAVVKYGVTWTFIFLCTGLFEESFLRGYPQRVLTDGIGFWPAAIVLSALFSLLHFTNGGENPFGLFMVFVDGMLMCFALWRTGNMWFGVGNHAAWDWAQTFFFGTPDSGLKPLHSLFSPSFHGPPLLSGGSAGPEGSILVLVSEALIAIFVLFVYPKRQYPLMEDTAISAEAVPEGTPLPLP